MSKTDLRLIADIGGTNARFGLLEGESTTPVAINTYTCADYPGLIEAIEVYLDSVSTGMPSEASIAVASVVDADQLSMTNHTWSLSISGTRKALGLERLKVLNDFTALALAIPHLSDDQFHKIGGGEIEAYQPKAIIGPGTGLGVSGLLPCKGTWYPVQGEGGHVSYGSVNEREADVLRLIRQTYQHVSAETLVSGSGLSLLYSTLSLIEKNKTVQLEPSEVTRHAIEGDCPIANEALSLFCEILGTVAGNLALTLGAKGGLYIGGGIIPRMLDVFSQSGFRERFEQHGRFTSYLEQVPVYVIIDQYPALLGAAQALHEDYMSIGVSSSP